MLNGNIYYHGTIRKSIIAFGRLFSDIYIDRKQGDSVNGTTVQRLHIPIAYAPKEKWLVRLDSDPNLETAVQTTLPRISFEINGYSYDSSRKTNRMQQIKSGTTGNQNAVYTPVPYNVSVSLYVLTKTQEDGLQILEQILPTFTPEYTLTLDVMPEMGISIDVPIILNSVQVQDEYEGDFTTRRTVIHTLDFEMKLNLFGPVAGKNVITQVNANVGQTPVGGANRKFNATGDPATTTVTSETWTGQGL